MSGGPCRPARSSPVWLCHLTQTGAYASLPSEQGEEGLPLDWMREKVS